MAKAHFYDVNGDEVPDAAGAVTGEIEADDGTRVYMDLRPYMPEEHDAPEPFSMVSNDEAMLPENADALKAGTWDLYDDAQEPIETLAGLLASFGWWALPLADARAEVCKLLELPSWEAAPEELKRETYDWLVATR